METTIMGYIGTTRRNILGFYGDNGKENGNPRSLYRDI